MTNFFHPPIPPEDAALKTAIEDAAKHCAANPSFAQALAAASAAAAAATGDIARKDQPFQFIFDPTAEGHEYFKCLHQLYSQQQHQQYASSNDKQSLSNGIQTSYTPQTAYPLVQPLLSTPVYNPQLNITTTQGLVSGLPPGFQPPPPPPETRPPFILGTSRFGAVSNTPVSSIPLGQEYDIANLAIQYKEPDFTETDIIIPQNILSVFEDGLSEYVTHASCALIGCPTVETAFMCIQPFLTRFLSIPIVPIQGVKSIRQKTELTQSYVGRFALSALCLVLMSTGQLSIEWKKHILPHFIWILRLAYIAGSNQQEKLLITGLLRRLSDTCHMNEIEIKQLQALLECPVIPSVSSIFNTPLLGHITPPRSESRRKPRFDVVTLPSDTLSTKRSRMEENKNDGLLTSTIISKETFLQADKMSNETSTVVPQSSSSCPVPSTLLPTQQLINGTLCPLPNTSIAEDPLLTVTEGAPEFYIDPDIISVGLLATMLKQVSKRARNLQAAFVPYRPLDPLLIPAAIPIEPPNDYLADRLVDLFEDIDSDLKAIDLEEARRPEPVRCPSSPPRRRQKEPIFESHGGGGDGDDTTHSMRRQKRQPREFKERGSGLTSQSEANWEKPVAWAQAEMGIAEDGSLLGTSSDGRSGLGATTASSVKTNSTTAADGLFDDYRKHRAHRYHRTIAQAHAERLNDELHSSLDSSKLCFICQKPGHLARECKFGLT